MKIKIGNYDVLDSGTIVGNLNEPIDFILNSDSVQTLRLFFVDDKDTKDSKVSADKNKTDGRIIELTFTNYNNPIGMGNVKPIRLGTYEQRALLFNFRIYTLEGGGKHIHYTWILGEEAKDE